MKLQKWAIGFLTVSMLAAGCSSASKDTAQETKKEDKTQDTKKEETANTQLANPVKEVTKDELTQQTGLDLEAPEDATDVVYSVIDDSDGTKLAQVDFKLNGTAMTYRAQSVSEPEGKDISGVYETWTAEEPVEIQHCTGTLKSSDNGTLITWTDTVPGISYSLFTPDKTDQDEFVQIANQIFIPAQGNEDGDA